MILNQQSLRFAVLLAALSWIGVGCSGINTSQGVSPATLLVPGIFGATPGPTAPPLSPDFVPSLALAK